MGEVGIVTEILENKKVKVRLKRIEACAKCRACTVGMQSKDMFIIAKNNCEAKLNEKVNIELESVYFFRALGVMYFIPFIFLISGFYIGYIFAEKFNISNFELFSFLTGIVFTLISYVFIRLVFYNKPKYNFIPTATNIVN